MCMCHCKVAQKKMRYRLVIRIVSVAAVRNTNGSMRLRHLFAPPDSAAGIGWRSPRPQQCHIISENYGLVCVDDRNLHETEQTFCQPNRRSSISWDAYAARCLKWAAIVSLPAPQLPNFCGLYPGKCVTPRHVSSVGVPSNLNILSSWSYVSRMPGNVGIPVIISTNIQPTPHISSDVE